MERERPSVVSEQAGRYHTGVPDFEFPHVRMLNERPIVMMCICGQEHQVRGLDWMTWIVGHASCASSARPPA